MQKCLKVGGGGSEFEQKYLIIIYEHSLVVCVKVRL